ncbi:MAG: MipA/OmpV family protein [Emcibacteraceae bacterium]|nr:MipA/OmpV family protein [Emcibacteraceae bacterium]
MKNILKFILLGSITLSPLTVHAADEINDKEHIEASEGLWNYKRFLLDENGKWSLGVGSAISNSPFRGEKISVTPIPIIDYSSKNLFIRGLRAGYHIKKITDRNKGGLFLDGYLAPRLRPGDSRKKLTHDAGLSGGYQYGLSSFSVSAQQDITDTSNGTELSISYALTIPFVRKNLFIPNVSMTWQSQGLANYLWGIDQETFQKTLANDDEVILNPYTLNSSVLNFSAGITHVYRINDHWNTMAIGKMTSLDEKITKNPAVERSLDYSFILGTVYTF